MTVNLGISMLVYGFSKVGKSWLGDTSPAPRLVLDAEAGSRFTPSRKVVWDPSSAAPPVDDGTWDTCLVYVNSFAAVARCFDWLNSGQHPFNSVIIDSISEVQQRAVDSIAGTNQMQIQNWGELLRVVSDVVRKFRDLITNPVRPLQSVLFIAMIKKEGDRYIPLVQGTLKDFLPFYVDCCAYLYTEPDPVTTQLVRKLLVSPHENYMTGERLGGRLGAVVTEPNIQKMLAEVASGQITEK